MAKAKTRGALTPQAIADHAFAASGHLVSVPAPSLPAVGPEESTEAVARATARAVLDEQQNALDRLEPVLEAMTAVVTQSIEAKRTRNGRELTDFERDPAKFGRFVRLLARGNYRETACKLARIAPSSVRNWMKAAEDGDERYRAAAEAIAVAEACAEDESIGDVRSAGKDPRFWTASMTWAERKFPDRWGRRVDDNNSPRVVVQIGARDSDVTINVGGVNRMVDDELLPADQRIPHDVIDRQRASGYQVEE